MRLRAVLYFAPFVLTSWAGAQSSDATRRLATLGRVWGFLKYFDPGVAAGSIDWDSALVATAPRAAAAVTKPEFTAVIASLIAAGGELPDCPRCQTGTAPDSMRRNSDLSWLADSAVLGSANSRRLIAVRDHRHIGTSRYVFFGRTPVFYADTAFNRAPFPSEWQRVVALFRFWNAIQYYFPYLYANGPDWNGALEEFIPRLRAATSAREYQLTIMELSTRIHDTHVGTVGYWAQTVAGQGLPPFEVRSVDGQIVVWKVGNGPTTATSGLRVGDVITHVDGVAVEKRRRDFAKYVPASNPAAYERRLVAIVLIGQRGDSATYNVERNGVRHRLRVAMRHVTPPAKLPVSQFARILPGTNVGYIDMGGPEVSQVDSALRIVENADGIIMDLRGGPRSTALRFAELLLEGPRQYALYTNADSTFPGQVVWQAAQPAGPLHENAKYYKGRVAILVDEQTQSQGEFTAMILQTVPGSKVVGSQTAGADGNINSLGLPGGLRIYFSGLGVYYPDGRETQRVGIVPDIVVRPTLRGIRSGRDELLERGIEYIQSGR